MKTDKSTARYQLNVAEPFRLDLTVSVLRRLSTNTVDIITPEGHYVRALGGFRKPVIIQVAQVRPAELSVTIEGAAADHSRSLAIVRRMLGVESDLSHFYQAAKKVSWLHPLATAMRGVKPPRYPTLWEACVNAIVFQQVSLVAASSILRRMISLLSAPIDRDIFVVYPFPSVESFMGASDDLLRDAGLSANKLAALRRAAEAIGSRGLDESSLEKLPSTEASAQLCKIKGIGPWTATLILLRGLGRLDVFPMHDSSVSRNLSNVAGLSYIDIEHVLSALGPHRGMLYYHLLLSRLDAGGDLGRSSVS
jgi:DNA-3-methyladenine glycosylase II